MRSRLALLLVLAACSTSHRCPTTEDSPVVWIRTGNGDAKEHGFQVEIADTPEERATGLMHRSKLADDAGMLFRLDGREVRSFHMLNTLIPLDLIGIDRDRVVSIDTMEPCEITPCVSTRTEPATDALEINGGLATELGIEVGDRVRVGHWPCY